MKTAAHFLSIRTHQLYEKGKEEMEKKKNIRLWNNYYWQLKIFSPQIMKMPFHMCMHVNGYEWKQEGKELA